jgi:uncharacterized protein (DUF433 family)
MPDLVSARVTANPQVRSGQPIIRGTRITVWDILGWLGGGIPESHILSDYPELSAEDIQAALQFAEHSSERPTMREWLQHTPEAKPIPAKKTPAQIVRELRDQR